MNKIKNKKKTSDANKNNLDHFCINSYDPELGLQIPEKSNESIAISKNVDFCKRRATKPYGTRKQSQV